MTGSIPDHQPDRLNELLAGCVQELGLDLEEASLTPAGKHRVLRIAVDQDGGVTIDDIARATRAISALLDQTDPLGALPYTLEVGSRGASSPLTQARHWRRNQGRLVRVELTDGSAIVGRVASSDDRAVQLTTTAGDQAVSYDEIDQALVQFELNQRGH